MLDHAAPHEPRLDTTARNATSATGTKTVPGAAVGDLSESARQFAQAAALVGDVFSLQEIARVQSVTTLSMLPALEETISAGLIRFSGDRLAFRSPDTRRALNARIPAPVRRTLLRDVTAPRPARQPFPNAHSASDSLVSALFLSQDSPDHPLDARTEAAMRQALVEALSPARDTGPAEAEAALVLSLFGHDEQGKRDRARAIVRKERQGAASVVAAVVLSNLEWAAGQLDEGLAWGREALRADHGTLPAAWRPYPSLALAVKLVQLGHFAEAEAELTRSRDLAEGLRHRRALAEAGIVRGRLLLGTGRTDAAEAEVSAGVALAQRAQAHLAASQGLSLLSLLSLARGHQGEAADQVWRARMELVAQPGTFPSLRHSWADFLVAASGMDARGSVDLLVERFPSLLTSPSLFLRDPGAAARLVRLSRAAGENSLAAAVTRRVERLAEQNPRHPGLAAAAGHAWGLLHQDADAVQYAAAEHRAPWAAAAASEDLGLLLVERHGPGSDAALRHLRAAAERYRAIGSLSALARLEPLLRAARESRPEPAGAPSCPERYEAPAGAVLTAAERRIAHLVAEGLTNKQVANRVSCSPHTVNYHLRQIFRKLGVTSRVELARLMR
ncbi:LuxR C-terminal-related transcriptional regulator [Streptomyces kanamyceticus]|uniref:LuxR C-terminal-related transcriptional regulator n=1 Tax=Streptomyces kanamyceticus TaxID=1967 RepID=UPI0037DC7D65